MKILIHAPISNRAWVLPEWWRALRSQKIGGHEVNVLFDLNDSQDETETLLETYSRVKTPFNQVFVRRRLWGPLNLGDHCWNESLYSRMRIMRTEALKAAEVGGYHFVFSLDSDVLLRESDTLMHMLGADFPIMAGVFRAVWGNPDAPALPNVWEHGQNDMTDDFLQNAHRNPDHFRVGGLGACTLIRHDVWEKGVTYAPVYNLPRNYRGEDRDFCVRAVVAGFDLMACSHKRIDHVDKPKTESEVTQ